MNNQWFQPQTPFFGMTRIHPYNLNSFYHGLAKQMFECSQYLSILYPLTQYVPHCENDFSKEKDLSCYVDSTKKEEAEAESLIKIAPIPQNQPISRESVTSDNTKLELGMKTEALAKEENSLRHSKIEFTETKRNTSKVPSLPDLKNEISYMIQFLIKAYGKDSENEMEKQRMRYAHNDRLLELFDILSQKYSASTKCREDMVRLSIRKAIAFMRDTLRTELKLTIKQASVLLCKKCFLQSTNKKTTDQINFEGEDEDIENKILNFFLPYKKQSRNRTPNASFINEVFLSEDFFQDYLKYLSKFDEIIESDNQKKMIKLQILYMTALWTGHSRRYRNLKDYLGLIPGSLLPR